MNRQAWPWKVTSGVTLLVIAAFGVAMVGGSNASGPTSFRNQSPNSAKGSSFAPTYSHRRERCGRAGAAGERGCAEGHDEALVRAAAASSASGSIRTVIGHAFRGSGRRTLRRKFG